MGIGAELGMKGYEEWRGEKFFKWEEVGEPGIGVGGTRGVPGG